MGTPENLEKQQREELINILKNRFERHSHRHKALSWEEVAGKLESRSGERTLWSLWQMEESGGEPDVIGRDEKTGQIIFCDCATESPSGRRSVCYDLEGLESRKANKPENNAIDMARAMGVDLLTEEEYHRLQLLERFDTKTSSWLQTPEEVRALGGAIFGDRRYDRVFIYHNGAQSYYAARGFRAAVRL